MRRKCGELWALTYLVVDCESTGFWLMACAVLYRHTIHKSQSKKVAVTPVVVGAIRLDRFKLLQQAMH